MNALKMEKRAKKARTPAPRNAEIPWNKTMKEWMDWENQPRSTPMRKPLPPNFEMMIYATGKSMAIPRAPSRTGPLPPWRTAEFWRVATGRVVVDVGSSPAGT